jgi:hypothetical protein
LLALLVIAIAVAATAAAAAAAALLNHLHCWWATAAACAAHLSQSLCVLLPEMASAGIANEHRSVGYGMHKPLALYRVLAL